ncbi:hypothetical protein KKG83_07475 [Candidatus Micrarchaeota archaeon]|nr:hypothetical protein [Candidatus Micrarchaeota archaeon]
MLIVNDAMVLIHLAKITLLEKSCDYFGKVLIPEMVFDETVKAGKKKGFDDAMLIEEIIKKGKIKVKKIKKKDFVKRVHNFNVFGGEAEAVALYWQEQANLMASDDDNVRRKKELLEISLIGTPSIILALFAAKKIKPEKARQSINKLRKIGWFSNEVLDRILLEVEKNE